jgi:molecular chaperone GrpE
MSHHSKHKHHENESHQEAKDSQEVSPTTEETATTSIGALELESLRRELAESKDKYLRVLAESENARKRLQKEKHENIQYVLQNAIVDFLNPIDHMENALGYANQMSDDVKNWAMGFQMILSQFKDVLSNNGVSSFVSLGTHFDPHRHEAIEIIETTEVPPEMVVEETLKGYLMGDKVIRPARVKVSKAPKEPNTQE